MVAEPAERVTTIILRDAVSLPPARARIVEAKESFDGVMAMRGRVNGEQSQQGGVELHILLDADGETPQGMTEQMRLTLGPKRGNRFRRDRRYALLVYDVTDEEREDD